MKRMSKLAYIVPVFAGLVGHAIAQTSPAASAKDDAAVSENSEQVLSLGTVIVTAQQRGEDLQDAALAINAVTGDALTNAGIADISSLDKLVPSLTIAGGDQGNLVFIRGVGTFSFSAGTSSATAFNYDGVYVGRSFGASVSMFDLERVEVLKGPQGTLYGRNATAGAINVLPVQPILGEESGYAALDFGNYNSVAVQGAANIPLGEKSAFRISLASTKHDGYLDDGMDDQDAFAARAQLKTELSSDVTVRFAADYTSLGGMGQGSNYVASHAYNPLAGAYVFTDSGIPIGEGLYSAGSQAFRQTIPAGNLGRGLDPLTERPFLDTEIYGVNAQMDWETALGTFTVIPSFRHTSKDNISIGAGQYVRGRNESDQYTFEARLVSNNDGPIEYNLGAYYFQEEVTDNAEPNVMVSVVTQDSVYDTKSPAAYGRLTYHVTDRLRLTGGLRYSVDDLSYDNSRTQLLITCAVAGACPNATLFPYANSFYDRSNIPTAGSPPGFIEPGLLLIRADALTQGSNKTNKTTYRGAVEFDLAPESLAYASVETGYRSGGFNADRPYGPENITAYTIGFKNRFLDNRLQLNFELFNWEYKDQQLTYLGVNDFGQAGILTRNIGKSVSRGAELETQYVLTPSTLVSASVLYNDTEYKSFEYQTPAPPLSACAVTRPGLFNVDCSGFSLFNAPEWVGNFGIEQRFNLGNYEVVAMADTQYKSEFFSGFEFLDFQKVDAKWTSNAQISFAPSDGNWKAAVYVRNISDERYLTYGTPAPLANMDVGIASAPRTYGVRLSANF